MPDLRLSQRERVVLTAIVEIYIATGEPVAVICAANSLAEGGAEFVPFAMLFSGNPYEAVNRVLEYLVEPRAHSSFL